MKTISCKAFFCLNVKVKGYGQGFRSILKVYF